MIFSCSSAVKFAKRPSQIKTLYEVLKISALPRATSYSMLALSVSFVVRLSLTFSFVLFLYVRVVKNMTNETNEL